MKKLFNIFAATCAFSIYAANDLHPCDDGPVGRDCRSVSFRLSPDIQEQDVVVGPFARKTRDHYGVTCKRTDKTGSKYATVLIRSTRTGGALPHIPMLLGNDGGEAARQLDSADFSFLNENRYGLLLSLYRVERDGNPKDPIEVTCTTKQWNKSIAR